MVISISINAAELGMRAGRFAAERLREAIEASDEASLVLSTGASQFETLAWLITEDVDWTKVSVFHLDEYIGLPASHKASFRKYLYERFISKITCKTFYAVDTEGDIEERIRFLTARIREKPIDVGLIGIGVNGHIAFNDPPADFSTREAYITVNLDDVCKKQQVDEGWFASVDEVPSGAVTMTVWQIMQCRTIISAVPHAVKADAVSKALTSKPDPLIPASILKQHNDFNLFLDYASASKTVVF